jgi:hypothetical protein
LGPSKLVYWWPRGRDWGEGIPVDRDGHECEDGDGDREVGDEVVDGAVQGAEDPVSVRLL